MIYQKLDPLFMTQMIQDYNKAVILVHRAVVCVAEQLGADWTEIKLNDKLVDLGCDSLDHVETVMALEMEFDIHIPDDLAELSRTGKPDDWGSQTVGDLVGLTLGILNKS